MAFYSDSYRHAFYLRRGRQRCALRHVIPLYNKHPAFTFCVLPLGIIPDFVLPLRNKKQIENSPVALCPTRESNPRPLAWRSRTCDHSTNEAVYNKELKCGKHEEVLCLHSCPTCNNLSKPILGKPFGAVDKSEEIIKPKCAGPNEVYTTCKKSCPPETCFSLVARFSCDGSEPCRNGCVCKSGFLRKSLDSPCVPICQCPEMKHSPDCENKS
ncbi:hypothetical protein SFRURICE_008350 [Spodoptera frugiperda]|nr:hypothetical protein SFRURICE_008350 [Spodoptera frugiperda]